MKLSTHQLLCLLKKIDFTKICQSNNKEAKCFCKEFESIVYLSTSY